LLIQPIHDNAWPVHDDAWRDVRDAASRAKATPESLIDRLKQALPAIDERATECDIAGRFPAEDVRLLNEIGLLRAFAEPADGGSIFANRRAFADCLMTCLRLIGRANLSLGRIFEGHVNATLLVGRYGDGMQRERLSADLAAGKLFGVWNTEPTPGVTLSQVSRGWRLSGSKSFATGAGYLDRVIVTGRLPDGRKQMLVAPVGDEPTRADGSRWRTSGMRATVSGTYDFSDMSAQTDMFLGEPGDYEREPLFTAGAWRFTAAQLGAIEALVGLLRSHLRQTGGDENPIQRARFGRAVVAARTAFLWVREAAYRAEDNPAPEASAFVLLTRGVVEEAGLAVMEAVQRGVGTRAFFTGNAIDRVMRDLQLYLRQPAPDQALDRAAKAWLETDCWGEDAWW
jgi:alkylation response protein AidB-like acyl-CoA dehydrogenase